MHFYLYKITNRVNDKIYIGIHKTKNLEDGYFGSGKLLNYAIKKYGKENFNIQILEMFDTEEAMVNREIEIVNEAFINRPDVYNIMVGGRFGDAKKNGLSFSGQKHTDATKRILSEKMKEFKHSDATKEKMRQNSFARKNPDAHKAQVTLANKNKPKSDEHKKKIRASLIGKKYGKMGTAICTICGAELPKTTITRYHNSKCKKLDTNIS